MKGKTYLLSHRNKKQEWGREICIQINVPGMAVLGQGGVDWEFGN